ncbi:MAG TPA: glycerophosphodiester phosphodiesterase [Candidatus Limnocylindrales bacterium]
MTSIAGRPLRLAHRGDWRRAPENTIEALLAALEIPACDGVEFDVTSSKDGVPVLLHDDTLARVQHRPERADALSAAELEAAGVPRLEAVLAALPERAFLDVELKDVPAPSVVDLLEAARGKELRNAVVSSFHVAALEPIRRARPAWPLWLNSSALDERTIAVALRAGCRGISAEWQSVNARSVARANEAGLEIASWTIRRRSMFDRLARAGVVAVCVEAAALDG